MNAVPRTFSFIAISIALGAPAAALVGGAKPADDTLARHVLIVVGGSRTGCSGTVIARDLVLTAAHCVEPRARLVVIEPGSNPRRTKRYAVTRFERHPDFDVESGMARRETTDVALLKLAEPLAVKIAPATLGTRDYFPIGDHFIVAGYGITGPREGGFGVLRSALLVVVRHTASGAVRLADPEKRGETPGLGACSGDSGGPVFEASANPTALVGVVSWATDSTRHAGCGGLTGMTPLARVREWIVETSSKLGSKIQP